VVEEITADGFLVGVREVAKHLRSESEALVGRHPDIFESVRGVGLMLGFKCKVTNIDLWHALRDAGLLTVPAEENVVRFLPPLTIDKANVDEAIGIFDKVAGAWNRGDDGA